MVYLVEFSSLDNVETYFSKESTVSLFEVETKLMKHQRSEP